LTCVLVVLGQADEKLGIAVQVGRTLVLADVLEEPAIKEQVKRIRALGALVFPTIGRLFQESKEGESRYELTLFLFVRDAGYLYQTWYQKLGPKRTPVLVVALPGGVKDLSLERIFK